MDRKRPALPPIYFPDSLARNADWPKQGKPEVTLVGEDGNAFNILGLCQRAARDAGWSQKRIDAVMAEMRAGDYDHLLQTAMKHFDVR